MAHCWPAMDCCYCLPPPPPQQNAHVYIFSNLHPWRQLCVAVLMALKYAVAAELRAVTSFYLILAQRHQVANSGFTLYFFVRRVMCRNVHGNDTKLNCARKMQTCGQLSRLLMLRTGKKTSAAGAANNKPETREVCFSVDCVPERQVPHLLTLPIRYSL